MPRLRLIAGPNGAGKSTFTANILRKFYGYIDLGEYINPDEIASNLEGDDFARAKKAQQIAVQQREQLLCEGKSMTYESVMSHPSHLDFLQRAKTAGYRTYFYFVGVEMPDINKERVRSRKKLGGHSVPAEKIVSRYYKTMAQLFDVCLLVNRAYIFDNSLDNFYLVAEIHDGQLTIHRDNPVTQLSWYKTYLLHKF